MILHRLDFTATVTSHNPAPPVSPEVSRASGRRLQTSREVCTNLRITGARGSLPAGRAPTARLPAKSGRRRVTASGLARTQHGGDTLGGAERAALTRKRSTGAGARLTKRTLSLTRFRRATWIRSMIAATKLQPDHGQCQVVGPRLNGRGAVRTETGDSEVSRPGFAIEAGDVADLLDSLSGQGLRACVPERLGAVDALLGPNTAPS
jgi:hypothetical protein